MTMILFVDDFNVNRSLHKVSLEREGYKVLEAMDGVEALELLAANPVDLIIADIEMPRMNGLQLLEHVRQSEEYAHLPVIIITGSGIQDDEADAALLGADAFIHRPISRREILDVIQMVLGRATQEN